MTAAWFIVGIWSGFLAGVFVAPHLWRRPEATS